MKTPTNSPRKSMFIGALSSTILLTCMLAFSSAPAFGQNAKLQLSQLDKLASKASKVTNVSLDGSMLKLAADQMSQKASKGESEKKLAAAGLVQRLKGIYVKSFEFDKPGEYTKADLDSVMKQIETGGWKAMVHVEEKKSGETTGIYVMEEGGEAVGMAIVAAEPKELTVVNLVGPINLSQLGGMGTLGALGQLGGIAGSMGKSDTQLQHQPATTPKNKGDSK